MLRRIGKELDDSLKEVDSLKEIPNDRSDSTRTKPYLQLEDCATNVAMPTYDVAVIGAGAFGAWSAHWLRRSRRKRLVGNAGNSGRLTHPGYATPQISISKKYSFISAVRRR